MSTKGTLAYNYNNPNLVGKVPPENCDLTCPDFHFYRECFDEDGSVYLELRGPGVEFEASNHGVTMKIPVKVWNRIIKVGPRQETS